MQTALILAGAVAKGAFEAGVIEVLAERAEQLGVTRVIGASAGALNASAFAVGRRNGADVAVAQRIVSLWSDSANWHNVVDFNLGDILKRTGFATADRVAELLRRAVEGLQSSEPRKISLTLVMTALAGRTETLQGKPATTFESSVTFSDAELDAPSTRERILQSALASAAFPVLFAPVDVPGLGACVDGGALNNTPVGLAIDDPAISRILVVTAEPLTMKPPAPLAGVNLLSHLAEILINERVYRDLHAAEKVNGYLRALDALRSEGVAEGTLERMRSVLGWRPLEIVQIRPSAPLPGNGFEAFGNADLRREYIEAGRRAARAALP